MMLGIISLLVFVAISKVAKAETFPNASVKHVTFPFEYFEYIPTDADWSEFMEIQEEIVTKANSLLVHGYTHDPLGPYLLKGFDTADVVDGRYEWATHADELTKLEKNIKGMLEYEADPQSVSDGALTNYLNQILTRLGKGVQASKPFNIVMYGIQSMGKSWLMDQILGFSFSYSAPGQGTRCPVYVHVHGIDSNEIHRDTRFYWKTDSRTSEEEQFLTEEQMKDRMRAHMNKIKVENGGHENVVIETPLHIAIYTTSAKIEGTIIDCPGWLGSQTSQEEDSDQKRAVKQISFDILLKVLADGNVESLFLLMEAVEKGAQANMHSMMEMIEFMEKANKKSEAHAIISNSIMVLNKCNQMMQYDSNTQELEYSAVDSGEDAAIKANIMKAMQEVLGKAEKGYSLKTRPFLVGIDVNKDFGGDQKAYDIAFGKAIEKVPDLNPNLFFSVGLTSTVHYLVTSRRKAFRNMIDASQSLMKKVLLDIGGSGKKAKVANPAEAYNAVQAGFDRFKEVLNDFYEGRNNRAKTRLPKLLIPGEDRRPHFADTFFDGSEKNFFKELGHTELAVGGKLLRNDVNEFRTNLDSCLVSHQADHESMSGKNELEFVMQEVTRLLDCITFQKMDSAWASSASTNGVQYEVGSDRLVDGIYHSVHVIERMIMTKVLVHIRKMLHWFFDGVVDVILILERMSVSSNPSGPGVSRLNILDSEYATLQFRKRVKSGFNEWIDRLMNNQAAVIDFSITFPPERMSSMLFSFLYSISDMVQLKKNPIEGENGYIMSGNVEEAVKKFEAAFSAMTPDQSSKLLTEGVYGTLREISHIFNPKNQKSDGTKDVSNEYAKLFFNSVKIPLLVSMNVELLGKLLTFAADNHGSAALLNIVRSFVFHPVGKADFFVAEMGIQERLGENVRANTADVLIVVPATSDTLQDKYLSQLYCWSSDTCAKLNDDAPAGTKDLKDLLSIYVQKLK